MSFGEKIYTERKRKGLTAKELARRVCVSRSYITLLENDRRSPGKTLLPKIAKALKLERRVVVKWYLADLRKKLGF